MTDCETRVVWAVGAALGALSLAAGCVTGRVHPVQPTPASWVKPARYALCETQETIRWPNGRRTVSLDCPDALLLVDFTTGELVERVTWKEINR